jgi:hypothetical protein
MFLVITAGLVGIVVFCGIVFVMLMRSRQSDESCDSVPGINRRKEPRVPVASEFDLFWQDVDASRKSTRARGIEICGHGVSVRSPKPILRNSIIQIRGCQLHIEGNATVRHCTRKGFSYVIGLELEAQQLSRTARA